ncbi:MAG: helix-turn-helix transcriptional regulator [Pyrinomonadaceae bacterium]
MENLISQNDEERLHLTQMRRLTEIHRLISCKKYPNTKDLSKRLEVHRRTIRRDIAFMRDSLNAPIKYENSKNGFCYTHENWEMPLVSLTEGELLAFFIATIAIRGNGNTIEDESLRRAIAKIGNSLPESVSVRLGYLFDALSFQAPPHVVSDGELLNILHEAINSKQTIEFEYYSPHTDSSGKRKVNPLLLHNHEGTWYLASYDHLRRDYRDFHTARISNLKLTNEFFETPINWNKEDYLNKGFAMYRGGEEMNVEIIFDKYQSKWMRERTLFQPNEKREELDNGRLKLKFTVGENGLEAVARFCLQYAGNFVAVKPEELKEIIKEKLEKALEHHK